VGNSKSNKAFIAGLVMAAGLTLFVIIVIGWNTPSNTARQTTAAIDPSDPGYWTPERIALSHARADAAAHGKVLIGMYAPDCEKAWGKPERVDKMTTANGVSEWWWYRGGRALHLENRILVSIHE
jgi:hypothetical protein